MQITESQQKIVAQALFCKLSNMKIYNQKASEGLIELFTDLVEDVHEFTPEEYDSYCEVRDYFRERIITRQQAGCIHHEFTTDRLGKYQLIVDVVKFIQSRYKFALSDEEIMVELYRHNMIEGEPVTDGVFFFNYCPENYR